MAGDIFSAFPLRAFRTDAESRKEHKRFERFCRTELSKYQHVLYVMGNHEYWRDYMPDVPGLLRDFLAEHAPHVRLLDNEATQIGGVHFVGTTLWADHGSGGPDELLIRRGYNDFNRIWVPSQCEFARKGRRRALPHDLKALHQAAIAFLHQTIPGLGEPVVLITHHAPSWQSAHGHDYGTPYLDPCYCSNQVDFILQNPHIKLAIHGHTHHRENYQIGDTKILSNPRGYYPIERIARWFDPAAADLDLNAN